MFTLRDLCDLDRRLLEIAAWVESDFGGHSAGSPEAQREREKDRVGNRCGCECG